MAFCRPSLLLVLLLSIFSIWVDASITLSNELTNFIPPCAQECFASFLESSFPTDVCTDNPTLDCICSSTSASGYTAGEGAIQCIVGEINIGLCTGNDAKDAVVSTAFAMCNGRENAQPNTHATISVSVILQTSMPNIVVVPPATLSSSSSSKGSRTSTSSQTPTPAPTTLLTATSTPATSSSRSRSTSAATSAQAAAETKAAVTATALTKPQVVGISVASVGGAAVVVGLLLLFFCLRRRRARSRDSDLPFQADPGTPGFYGGFRGPMEARFAKPSNGTWGKRAPRVPPRLETSDPYIFARRSIKPDTIGLAISPERNTPMEMVRNSRLLPEKPTLTLNTKQPVAFPGGLMPPQLNQQSRQSTATQFEEDDDSDETAVDDYYGRGSSDRILEQGANLQTIKIITPEQKPTFRITNPDISQNSSPEYQVQPLAVNRGGVGSFSRPRPGPDPKALQLQVPSRTTSRNERARPITAGSSVYSSGSNTPYIAPPTSPLTQNPFPMPGNSSQYQNPPRAFKSYKQQGPYDRASAGSMTSFDSVESSPDREHPRHTILMDLSPVVESPASGRSPVSYPRIAPPGRLTQQTIRIVPPPPQPDFASVFSSGGGRTQPTDFNPQNQILGAAGGQKPWQAAEQAAARQRRLSQQNQGQPRSQTYPIPQYREPQPQITLRSQQQAQTPQTQNQNRQQPKLASPFQPKPPPQGRFPPHQRQRSREYIAPSAHFNNPSASQLRPNAHLRDDSKTPSIASFASQTSNGSSLLAKRLGAEKAAQLNLHMKSEEERQGAKWRVLGKEEKEKAKDGNWRPQLVNLNLLQNQTQNQSQGSGPKHGVGGRGGGNGGATPQANGQLTPGPYSGKMYAQNGSESELPRTPGWVPRLTPTRRGDELFLSVA